MDIKAWLKDNYWFLILIAALQVVSIRSVFKYLPYPSLSYLLMLIMVGTIYYVIIYLYKGKIQLLKSPVTTFSLVVFMAVVNFFMYTKADALKHSLQGSDADDAVIVAASKLFHGRFPYDELTYLGHKMSPGPGILIFMGPFALTGLYFLAIPVYVLIFALLCKRIFKSYEICNLALLLVMSSLGFWEYMIIGSDLIVIGSLIAIFSFLSIESYDRKWLLLLLSITTGLLLTSRITLIYLIPVIAFIIFIKNRRAGIFFGSVTLITSLSIHAIFYFWQPENYAPLHLLEKGKRSSNIYLLILGVVVNLFLIISLLRKRSFEPASSMKYVWLFLAIPHLFIGISMLLSDKMQMAISEGPGYLLVQMFSFLLFYFFTIRGSNNIITSIQ